MKLLMLYCDRFAWRPTVRTLESAAAGEAGEVRTAVVGLIHVEPADVDPDGRVASRVVTRLLKNLKWLAGKNTTRTILLHSFSHLAAEKADATAGAGLFAAARTRLAEAGYEVHETPYGHFNDLAIEAPGHPLARVFKSF
ncbi:MAG: threonyl-tRNA synthetase editing domain-containing protein [Candidatus Eiseniibacteriota bacterium]|jgi:hypothetical protein